MLPPVCEVNFQQWLALIKVVDGDPPHRVRPDLYHRHGDLESNFGAAGENVVYFALKVSLCMHPDQGCVRGGTTCGPYALTACVQICTTIQYQAFSEHSV